MSIMILLPSATAFVPTTYADPPTGGGDEPDCSAEILLWAALAAQVKVAATAANVARQAARAAEKDEAATFTALRLITLIPSAGSPSAPYSPYANRAAWIVARDAAKVAHATAIAAKRAAQKEEIDKSVLLARAQQAAHLAYADVIACLNS